MIRKINNRKQKNLHNVNCLLLVQWFLAVTFIVFILIQYLFTDAKLNMTLLIVMFGFGFMMTQIKMSYLLNAPLPSLAVIGFGLSYFYIPVIVKTFQNESICDGLHYPEYDFLFALGTIICMGIANHLAIRMGFARNISEAIRNKMLKPLGTFKSPTELQMWIIGMFGIVAFATVLFSNTTDEQKMAASTLEKLVDGFKPFAYAPFLIFVSVLYDHQKKNTKIGYFKFIFYFLALILVGTATNRRADILFGFASTGICVVYCYMTNIIPLTKAVLRKTIIYAIVALLGLSQFQDLSTAMVIVRSQRSDVSGLDLLVLTFEKFFDKEQIRKFAEERALNLSKQDAIGWFEAYHTNEIANRVSNICYGDAALITVMECSKSDMEDIRKREIDGVVAKFPNPLIRLIGYRVDKLSIINHSMGDYYLYIRCIQDHARWALGGFKTGNMIVSYISVFGWFSPVALIISTLIVFILMNSMIIPSNFGQTRILINPVALIGMYGTTFMFTSAAAGADCLAGLLSYPIRAYWQAILLYALILWISKVISLVLVSVFSINITRKKDH
jgi:hypothetical protein